MKKLTLLLLVCLINICLFAQEDLVFDTVITVHSDHANTGRALFMDRNNNLYYTGAFKGTVDFDPKASVHNMTSFPNIYTNSYIVKLDSNENLVWSKQLSGNSSNTGTATIKDIVVDTNECVYVFGNWSGGSVDFDPGPGTKYSSSSEARAFFLKLDENGDFAWIRFISSSGSCLGNAIEIDEDGFIYLAGAFTNPDLFLTSAVGNVPTSYVQVPTYPITCTGAMSDFIIKYNSDGTMIWAKDIGSCDNTLSVSAISISPSGNIHIASKFEKTATIETISGALNVDGGSSSDGYFAKLNSQGDILWFKQLQGKDVSFKIANASGISVDNNENIYVLGYFTDSLDVDPGIGTHYFYSPTYAASYISKYDNDGNFIWSQLISATGQSYINNAFDIDDQNNLYISGIFDGTADFYGQASLASAGQKDPYFLKLDEDGNFIWVKRIGGNYWDSASDLILDQNNNLIACGQFLTTVDFDPNAGVFNVTSGNDDDAFVLKLKQCKHSTATFTHTACGFYNWYGTTYSSDNNTATHIIPNATGCDSIITLNLTIKPISQTLFTHTSCGPYQWIDGVTYSSNNSTALYTIPNGGVNGCDSLIKLNLTVININNTISVNNNVITANQTGATYQWVDCNNGNAPISGATSRSFTMTSNGNYAVLITKNGCTELSDCYEMSTLDITDIKQSKIDIHPNPASNSITVSNIPIESIVTITDLTGKVIYKEINAYNQTIINIESFSKGVYIINIDNKLGVVSERFIINR